MAGQHRREELVVILGTPNVESSSLYAMTVAQGDPSYAGPLAGTALHLPVFHITEADIKAAIPPEVYEDQVALAEMVLDTAEIGEAVAAVRNQSPAA